MDYMEHMTNANSIIRASRRADAASGWKEPTQRFLLNLLKETRKLQLEVRGGDYRQGAGSEFPLCENGHLRLIKALGTRDLILQHSLCDEVLHPALRRYLIHDNGASLKGKGISFTRRRFDEDLRKYFREHGTEGYILLIDFRKFFDNIIHAKLADAFWKKLRDDSLDRFIRQILKSYEVDVSYTDEAGIETQIFNSLEYAKIDRALLTGRRFMGKSLGIGSPLSQIAGIFFPTAIDTYCKTVRQVKHYGVYMDDRYAIHESKAFLHQLLDEIEALAHDMGLHINRRKTQIVKLSHGFTFLKTKYVITETGHIVKKIPHDVVVRQRRKMKKLAAFVEAGEMSAEAFREQYQSWRGDKKRYDDKQTLKRLDALYRSLYRQMFVRERQKLKRLAEEMSGKPDGIERLTAQYRAWRGEGKRRKESRKHKDMDKFYRRVLRWLQKTNRILSGKKLRN